MKPGRPDIAIPPFPPGLTWIGGEPPVAERLTAKGPLLVLFCELGDLSSNRALPTVQAWADRYAEAGLTVVGVHSPRNELARADDRLGAGLERLGVQFPVANDNEYRVWHLYGCKGWPSLFLWGRGGKLDSFHLGVDGLGGLEDAIRAQCRGGDEERELPDAVGDEPQPAETEVVAPSAEVFPSGEMEQPWTGEPGEPLEVEYSGSECWVSLDGNGSVQVATDGNPSASIEVTAPGLYRVTDHGRLGLHEVRLDLDPGLRVWSVSFAPGTR